MDPSPENSYTAVNGGIPGAATASVTAQTPTTNAMTSGDPTDHQKLNLNQVIDSVDNTLGILHQLYITVSAFSFASQLPPPAPNALVLELDAMQNLADNCNIQVPMEVVNSIDDGKNPDEFTRDAINDCIAKNQITKGRTNAFKSLRKHLLEELEQTFPDEVEAYREIRNFCCCKL